ncbi:helix-turn-helix domain-containing transcriptional regulator [Arthrobacter sp. Sr24]
MNEPVAFWDDLTEDLRDPVFLREFITESVRISAIDSLINSLDDARVAAGLSKAHLARAINMNPASMRRLFSGTVSNPTLATLAEVAAALGMRVTLEVLPEDVQSRVTRPLLDGHAENLEQLAQYLGGQRQVGRPVPVSSPGAPLHN